MIVDDNRVSYVIPSPIRVLGGDFRVSYDDYDNKLDRDQIGTMDVEKREIYVDDSMDLNSVKETILHELIHAVDHMTTTEEEHLSEQQVRRLSVLLFTIFRDNPTLTCWLFLDEDLRTSIEERLPRLLLEDLETWTLEDGEGESLPVTRYHACNCGGDCDGKG